jgi:hypothetical protein
MPPTAAVRTTVPTPPVAAPRPTPSALPFPFSYGPPAVVVIQQFPVIAAAPRPVRASAFNVIDPWALVGRTPSGRVVIAGPGPFEPTIRRAPYAPPSFQIIGAPSTRDMRGPVHLKHGVAPPSEMQTGPRVILLQPSKDRKGPLKPAG